jgi:hypothetical protein
MLKWDLVHRLVEMHYGIYRSSVSKVGLYMRTMERFVPVIWTKPVSSVRSKDPDVLHGNEVLTPH